MPENERPRSSSITLEQLDAMMNDIHKCVAEESKKHIEQRNMLASLNERSIHAIRYAASLLAKGKK